MPFWRAKSNFRSIVQFNLLVLYKNTHFHKFLCLYIQKWLQNCKIHSCTPTKFTWSHLPWFIWILILTIVIIKVHKINFSEGGTEIKEKAIIKKNNRNHQKRYLHYFHIITKQKRDFLAKLQKAENCHFCNLKKSELRKWV